ncbi:MAG: hypothetical protein GC181_01805 [Bacteroidetes bacterium]|nr:hypothetical protein [Bacteroidota bacterium]
MVLAKQYGQVKFLLGLMIFISARLANAQSEFIPQYGHQHRITTIVKQIPRFSNPSKHLVITGDEDGWIKIWQASTERLKNSFQIFHKPIKCLEIGAYPNTYRLLITYKNFDSVAIYDFWKEEFQIHKIDEGWIEARFTADPFPETDITVVYPDGLRTFTFSEDGKSRKFDSGFPNKIAQDAIYRASDLGYLQALSSDSKVYITNVGVLMQTISSRVPVINMEVSKNGKFVAFLGDTLCYLYSTDDKELYQFPPLEDECAFIQFDDEDSVLLIAGRTVNLQTLQAESYDMAYINKGVLMYDDFEKQDKIYFINQAGELRVVDGKYADPHDCLNMSMPVRDISFNPKSNQLALCRDVFNISIYDLNKAELSRQFRCADGGYPHAVAYNHSGNQLAVAVDRAIYLYNSETGDSIRKFIYQRPQLYEWPLITSLFFTNNDSLLVAAISSEKYPKPGGKGTSVWIWNVATGEKVDSTALSENWYSDVSNIDNHNFAMLNNEDLVIKEIGKHQKNYTLKISPNSALTTDERNQTIWLADPQMGISNIYPKAVNRSSTLNYKAKKYFQLTSINQNLVVLSQKENNAYEIFSLSKTTGKVIWKSKLDQQPTKCEIDPTGNALLVAFVNGTVEWFNANTGESFLALFTFSETPEYLFQNAGNFYKSSRDASKYVTLRSENSNLSLRNVELRLHRPDEIVQLLHSQDPQIVAAYKAGYEKRVSRELSFNSNFNNEDKPRFEIYAGDKLGEDSLRFFITIEEDKHIIKEVKIWLNGSPLFSGNGIDISGEKKIKGRIADFDVPLVADENEFEIAVVDSSGTESVKIPYHYYRPGSLNKNLYLICMGVSEFRQSDMNLKYAAKDATDIFNNFKNGINDDQYLFGMKLDFQYSVYDQVYAHLFINDEVTPALLDSIKQILKNANTNDHLIFYYAGHGLLNSQNDYFLSTNLTDFSHPENGSIPYKAIEDWLYEVPLVHKFVLIDACHSGELDPESLKQKAPSSTSDSSKLVVYQNPTRGGKSATISKTESNSFILMKELFGDVSARTGSTVFSSASGTGYAMESDAWNNGIFTYAILKGTQSKAADLNHDGEITISELIQYVSDYVATTTGGYQTPDCRSMNPTQDWRVW